MAGIVFTFAGDEAGYVSLNFAKGGSRYYVFTIVGTAEPDALREALQTVRSELKLFDSYEFSFHSLTSSVIRDAVFGELAACDMQIWSVIVDKQNLPDPFKIMHRIDFWTFFVCEVIELIPVEQRDNAMLILDEYSLVEEVERVVRAGMRKRNIPQQFRKVTSRRSSSESLVQVADLVSGAILRKHVKGDDAAFLKILRHMQKLKVFEE